MPHHPGVKLMKKFVQENKIGKILSFTYHLGAYLPDWHPWEDYRNVYFSKKETPGCKEMVAFELTWIVWMLGDVKRVSAFKGKLSSLKIDIDDVYQIILEFKNGVLGSMLIDIISRPSEREMRLIGENGTIHWYSEKDLVEVFDAKKNKWNSYVKKEKISQPGYSVKTHEEMYIEEIEDFVKAIKGKQRYPYTFSREKNIIKILCAVEESAKKSKAVEI
jgi:predicted dehydrogenase